MIFISYRRDDDPAAAARVLDGLAKRFGKANMFMDVDNLLAGRRFDEELAKALTSCDVFIAILGARWMELLQTKRAARERDYVQEEIAGALRRNIIVIPVRVGREGRLLPLPLPEDLPPAISDLVLYQKHDITHENFARDVAVLADNIATVRRQLGPTSKWLLSTGVLTAIASISIVVAGYAGAHYLGLPVPWPWHWERPQPPAPGAPAALPEKKAQRSPTLLDDIVIRRSNLAGGTGGEPFDDKFVNMQAAPVTSLMFTVARSVADQRQKLIASVQAHWSGAAGPVHGGAGAVIINPETRTIRFDNDEAVRQLIIFHRRFNWPDPTNAPVWVSGIQVRTSKSTYTVGDVDGTATECTLGRSEQIIGFFGRAGAYVDALGCLIR